MLEGSRTGPAGRWSRWMEEWKTMHGRQEEHIHNLKGTKHQVHVSLGEEHIVL